MLPPATSAQGDTVTLRRSANVSGEQGVTLRAVTDQGRVLARERMQFAARSETATLKLDLPSELRNQLSRLEIEEQPSAGSVQLLDDRWRRRPVGLVTGGAVETRQPLLGDLFSLSVAVWYSGYFLAVKAARATAGAMRITFWATLLGAPLLLLVAAGLGEDIIPASLAGWAACVAMGVMHVFGQGGVAWALGRLPASVTAVTILVQPVVAALLGWLIFGETLTLVQALGGALVLSAVVLAQRANRAPAAPFSGLAAAPSKKSPLKQRKAR